MPSPLPDAVDLSRVERALIIKLRHHGDVLLASPVFTVLKHAAPHVVTDALVYAETAPMLANHPAIDRLHVIDRGWKRQGILRQIAAERRLIGALRERRYDLLVHLTEHPRGATLARVLRPRYAAARERSDAGRWWKHSFTHLYRLPRATPRAAVEANLDALRRLGIYPQEADKRLVLVPGEDAKREAHALLAQQGLAHGSFLQAHPGSRWFFKCWPAAQWAALLDRLAARGHVIVLTGAPDPRERALVDDIVAAVAPATRDALRDVAGRVSFGALAAITARARAFLGVDSAPMHIAAAVGTPVVALFGPSGEREWGPWRVAQRVIVAPEFACRPCGIDGCGGGKVSECLTTIPAARVETAVLELLAATAGAA